MIRMVNIILIGFRQILKVAMRRTKVIIVLQNTMLKIWTIYLNSRQRNRIVQVTTIHLCRNIYIITTDSEMLNEETLQSVEEVSKLPETLEQSKPKLNSQSKRNSLDDGQINEYG